ncbi:MAG: ribosomal protein L7/L12, partial [Muribaculaceae bacterium]|nr:ribosomal protein L7/L12 [Muribaculaceae bacterium]
IFGDSADADPDEPTDDDESLSDDEEYDEEYDEEEESDDEEEDEEDDIIFTLESCGNSKLRITKLINETLGCGLKEAKEICDGAPIDVTVDGSYLTQVIDLVQKINDIGGEADWTYASFVADDDEDDEEEYDDEDSDG